MRRHRSVQGILYWWMVARTGPCTPKPESLANYGQLAEDRLRLEARFRTSLSQSSQTRDGWEVDLMLNIEEARI